VDENLLKPGSAESQLGAFNRLRAVATAFRLAATGDRRYVRLLCDPSQSGGLAVCLHWQNQTVFFSAISIFTGCRPVPLWDPSQNGGWLERPQEHHQ